MCRVISILVGTKFPVGMSGGSEPADGQLIWVEGNVEEDAANDNASKLEKQASRSSRKRNRRTKKALRDPVKTLDGYASGPDSGDSRDQVPALP